MPKCKVSVPFVLKKMVVVGLSRRVVGRYIVSAEKYIDKIRKEGLSRGADCPEGIEYALLASGSLRKGRTRLWRHALHCKYCERIHAFHIALENVIEQMYQANGDAALVLITSIVEPHSPRLNSIVEEVWRYLRRDPHFLDDNYGRPRDGVR